MVARGGKGGSGVRAPTREANKRELDRQRKLAEVSVVHVAGQLVNDATVYMVGVLEAMQCWTDSAS